MGALVGSSTRNVIAYVMNNFSDINNAAKNNNKIITRLWLFSKYSAVSENCSAKILRHEKEILCDDENVFFKFLDENSR